MAASVALHAQPCPCATCAHQLLVSQYYAASSPTTTGYTQQHHAALARTRCPLRLQYDFCVYGATCPLYHPEDGPSELQQQQHHSPAALAGAATATSTGFQQPAEDALVLADAAVRCINRFLRACVAVVAQHEAAAYSGHTVPCRVCGQPDVSVAALASAADTGLYVTCPNCLTALYLPELQGLVEAIGACTEHPNYPLARLEPRRVRDLRTVIAEDDTHYFQGRILHPALIHAPVQPRRHHDGGFLQLAKHPPHSWAAPTMMSSAGTMGGRNSPPVGEHYAQYATSQASRDIVAAAASGHNDASSSMIPTVYNDPYLVFKVVCDEVRRRLPHRLKLGFTFEAHRYGSQLYAWSLISSAQCQEVIAACVAHRQEEMLNYSQNSASSFFSASSSSSSVAAAISAANAAAAAGGGGGGSASTLAPKQLTRIISVGSGTGYVEHLFANASFYLPGASGPRRLAVFAIDERIPKHARFSTNVSQGGPQTLASLSSNGNGGETLADAVLLQCWPPFGGPAAPDVTMAFDATTEFIRLGGTLVLYIGDPSSTGDERFHQLLASRFRLIRQFGSGCRVEVERWSPQDMGLVYAGADSIGVYHLLPA